MTHYSGKYRTPGFRPRDVPATAVVTKPLLRVTERPASLHAADTTYAPKSTPDRYTGTACIGIAAMHKSNLVPVFTAAQAVDAATMRRG